MSDDRPNPLGPLHEADVPQLDATSRDRLEAGLRVQHAAIRSAPRRHGLPRRLVVAPIVAIVLVVATVTLVARDQADVAALELRDAENVTITLPDGAVVNDPVDGFALVDGAVVVVGPEGTVTIDEVTLAAGTVVRVRDGRLVTDVVATTTTDGPADRPGGSDDPPPARDAPPADARTTTTTTKTTTTTVPVDVRPADRPSDGPTDTPPTTTRAPRPPVDAERPPPDSLPAEAAPGDATEKNVAVALRVSRRDTGVRVAWNAEGVAGTDWRVIVVRTVDGSDPVDAGDGVVIGEGPRGETNDAIRDLPGDAEVLRYRVIILDSGDGVVARSAVQTLALG